MRRILLLSATMLAAVLLASGVALAAKPISDAAQITIKDSRTLAATGAGRRGGEYGLARACYELD